MGDSNNSSSQTIIIDYNCSNCLSGYSGDEEPSYFIPLSKEQCPIKNNIIINFDAMEKVWNCLFYNELKVKDIKEHSILLTESPINPNYNRERITEIMFETFNFQSMFIENQAVLSLYSNSRTTGIVLESGETTTLTTPIYEGHALRNSIINSNFAGKDITNYMSKLLSLSKGSGYNLDHNIVNDIKEKLSYISFDYDKEIYSFLYSRNEINQQSSSSSSLSYKLPDGKIINIDKKECFMCPEVLFKPSLIDIDDELSIHKSIHNSIFKCNIDIHKQLFRNIILSGGNTMFNGITKRLHKELTLLTPQSSIFDNNISIISSHKYSVFIGASILSSLSTFNKMLITNNEYNEYGSKIIHRKCF